MATATAVRSPAPRAPAPVATPAPRISGSSKTPDLGLKPTGMLAPGILELKGMSGFKPTDEIAQFLDSQKESSVNVRFGNLAQGPITVRTTKKGQYRIRKQPIPLSHPLFARAAEAVPDLTPCLVLNADTEKLTGSISLAAGSRVRQLDSYLEKSPDLLGLAGFKINSLPAVTNKLEGGNLHLGLANVPIRLGSAFSGTFTIDAVDESVTFSGNAAIAVKGLANGTLDLKRAPDGAVTGKATVGLNLPKNITGAFDVSWDGRAIDGQGKVGYKGEKLSGEINLHLMEKSAAEQLEAASKAPEGKPAAAPVKAKSPPAKIDYVVFGDGNLTFAFNEWLNGNAQVIINPKGYLTVIGKITPQKEFVLFQQKDYVKPLFKLEARATYGIPVVGDIFIFANVGMDAFAKLGPGKFYNIVVDGTYSTDPKQANNFTIRGTFSISAGAGLRLRAEAGAGLEILEHDIKAGAGINGIAGIKAYAEAVPIIGYREKGADGEDKKGEFFIRGELEIAGQPFLGLSGDLFVAIETPWWSPLSDHRWTWPLFSKEWPIGGSFGLGASVDYVFGSGQLPKLDFKPVDFSAEKFMTDMYQDKAKSGPGKEVEKKGDWKEKNSAAADVPPKVSPKGNAGPGKLPTAPTAKAKTPTGKKKGKPADPTDRTKDGKSVKQHQEAAVKKGKKPIGADAGKGGKTETGKKDAKLDERTDAEKNAALKSALQEATHLLSAHKTDVEDLPKPLKKIETKYKLTRLSVVKQSTGEMKDKVSVHGVINPEGDTAFIEFVHGMPRVDLSFASGEYDKTEYSRQIKDQETGLRSMKVAQWRANRDAFLARSATSESGRHPRSESAQARARRIVITALVFAEINRQKEEGKTPDQTAIRAQINTQFAGTAVLHAPDQIAGGEFDKFAIDVNVFADKRRLRTGDLIIAEKQAKKLLGNLTINSSIGSQWKDRAPLLDAGVKAYEAIATPADLAKQNLNARLAVV